MTRGALRRFLIIFVCAATLAVPSTSGADDGIPIDMGPADECLDLVPHLPTDFTRGTLRADIVVALDGVSREAATKIMNKAAEAYAPGDVAQLSPDVKLNVIAYHDLTGKLRSSEVSGYVVDERPQGDDLMSELIRYYHANYPKLARDGVHLLTNKNIYLDLDGQKLDAVLGITNCLGGIGTKYSYTIAEVGQIERIDIGPLRFLDDLDAKTTAHELGHAFGAQHHYANCVQFVPTAALNQTGDVCSLMFNDAEVIDLHFGAVEVATVRGTAEAHLKH
ncbi:MAG: zinc-dependent metalloprotease family protein [Actinomycetota bacterium]